MRSWEPRQGLGNNPEFLNSTAGSELHMDTFHLIKTSLSKHNKEIKIVSDPT